MIVWQHLRDFWWTKIKWIRLSGIFSGRSESGAGSSGNLVVEVGVGQALRGFCWKNWELGRYFVFFGGRFESEVGSSGYLVD
jgi:hypothetical protein